MTSPNLHLDVPGDARHAATALWGGAAVAHAFANFYVISSRPDGDTVRRINLMKGRPADQVGSVTTTPARVAGLFDWSQLPAGLHRNRVTALMDELMAVGPIGFRGPAAAHLPAHLTAPQHGVLTTQVIVPGQACPSNAFLGAALALVGGDHLYITSCNRSRHLTGAGDEPAHYRGDDIADEFGADEDFLVLRHHDEVRARRRYPRHAPMSTTILGFDRIAPGGSAHQPRLVVERHGSLPVDDLRSIAARFGFGLTLGHGARTRLALRSYEDSNTITAGARS